MSAPTSGLRRSNAAYRNVDRLFEGSAAQTGVIERRYTIAGRSVLMRFSGSAMLDRIGAAFAHLETNAALQLDARPALRINIWDSASTGAEAPPVLGGELAGDSSGPIYYLEEDGVQAIARWNTLSVYDSVAGEAWYWAPDAAEMLSWDWASPMRMILHWWLGRDGILQVHGGAVGVAKGGVLVVGRGGSGKSTTTLSCLNSGLQYAGDDFVAIATQPAPYIHSLYGSGKLESHHIERFPNLHAAVANPIQGPNDKAVVYAERYLPGVSTAGFPLLAVVVPRVAGVRDTRVVPASKSAALAALAPSTLFQLHPPHPNALAGMASLVRQVPCFTLELGTDLDQISTSIVGLLEGL